MSQNPLVIDLMILQIRAENGERTDRCQACNSEAFRPYRKWVNGKLVGGCTDACHGPVMVPNSVDWRWHFAPAAIKERKLELARAMNLVDGIKEG